MMFSDTVSSLAVRVSSPTCESRVYKTELYERLLKRIKELEAELAETKKEKSTS